jgi:hypothetical protein
MTYTLPDLPLDKMIDELNSVQKEFDKYLSSNINKFRALVSSAKVYIQENKEDTARKVIQQAWDLINQSLEGAVSIEIDFIRESLTTLKNSGYEIKDLREYLKKVRIAAESGDYIQAMRISNECREYIKKLKNSEGNVPEELKEGTKEEKNIEEQPKVEIPQLPKEFIEFINIKNTIEIASQYEINLKDAEKELPLILSTVSEMVNKIKKIIMDQLWVRYQNLLDIVDAYKNFGIDSKNYSTQLDELKKDMENATIDLCLTNLNSIEQKIMDPTILVPLVEKEMDIARSFLILTESQVKRFKEIKDLQGKGENKKTFELVYNLHRELEIGIKDNLVTRTNEIQTIVDIIKKSGVSDINEYSQMLKSYNDYIDKGMILNGYEVYNKIKSMSEKTFFHIIVQKSGDLRIKVLAAKNMGLTLNSNVDNLLDEIKRLTSEKKLVNAINLLVDEEFKLSTEMQLYKDVSTITMDIETKIRKLKDSGVDTKEFDADLTNIYSLMKRNYKEALDFANKIIQKINYFTSNYKRNLKVEINITDKIEKNKTIWGEFVIKNEGDMNIQDVSIQSSDVVIEDLPKISLLRPLENKKIKFTTVFDKNSKEIGIKIVGKDAFSNSEIITEYKKNFDVVPEPVKKEPSPAYTPIKVSSPSNVPQNKVEQPPQAEINKKAIQKVATSTSQCQVCKGILKPGVNIIQCSCGATFHIPCATRVKICPVCKSPLI